MGSRYSAKPSWRWPEFTITGRAYIAMALWLLLLPLQWIGAAMTAALIHEMGHILAIWAWGGGIWSIRVDAFGAKIETGEMSPREELVCALAGPGAGLLLLIFWRWLPRTALCALVQSGFNLLPIFPMDGGRALRAVGILAGQRKISCK